MDINAHPSSEYIHKLTIVPGLEIVVGSINNYTFDRISIIIDEKDDRLEIIPDHRREILASNLKRTISHKQYGTPIMRCHTGTQS